MVGLWTLQEWTMMDDGGEKRMMGKLNGSNANGG
jgi:hypothetical protein